MVFKRRRVVAPKKKANPIAALLNKKSRHHLRNCSKRVIKVILYRIAVPGQADVITASDLSNSKPGEASGHVELIPTSAKLLITPEIDLILQSSVPTSQFLTLFRSTEPTTSDTSTTDKPTEQSLHENKVLQDRIKAMDQTEADETI